MQTYPSLGQDMKKKHKTGSECPLKIRKHIERLFTVVLEAKVF